MPRSLLKLRKLTRFKTSVIKPPRCFWSMTIFGELDPERRNALLDHLPVNSQKLITATAMPWRPEITADAIYELRDRQLVRVCRR